MQRSYSKLALLLSLAVPLAMGLTPAVAQACGGTFCDAGPQTMPVDQTGESIVFWIDRAGDEPRRRQPGDRRSGRRGVL